jgi:hypothetical protein
MAQKQNKKYDEIDIAGFSALFNAGFRVTLRKNVEKAKNVEFKNLTLAKTSFMMGFAKNLGKDKETGLSSYGWTKDSGGIYLKFNIIGLRTFANVLEDYARYGEDCIHERPIKKFENGKYVLYPLDKPGFSRIIGTDVKKTYRIVLNTESWKSKNPERTIGIIVTEGSNTVSLSLPIAETLSLAQELQEVCNLASREEFKIQMDFTSNPKKKPSNVSVDEIDKESSNDSDVESELLNDSTTASSDFNDFADFD